MTVHTPVGRLALKEGSVANSDLKPKRKKPNRLDCATCVEQREQ